MPDGELTPGDESSGGAVDDALRADVLFEAGTGDVVASSTPEHDARSVATAATKQRVRRVIATWWHLGLLAGAQGQARSWWPTSPSSDSRMMST